MNLPFLLITVYVLFLLLSSVSPIRDFPEREFRENKWPKDATDTRLPDVLTAISYHIRIKPYFPTEATPILKGRNMTFDGLTTFTFSVKKTTNNFTLHTCNLQYSNITLMDIDGNQLNISSYTEDENIRHLTIIPSDPPAVGSTYLLQFVYTGLINPYTAGGLYYTFYDDIYGNRHWMVSTHMENGLQARSVFPCIDEPSAKAVFHITLIYPREFVALSNAMERNAVDMQNGWKVILFPPTPKMSTYLVALAIGPFVSKSVVNDAGTLVRIWGWTGQEQYLDFAAEISAKCLYQMGLYTNFTYPMVKSDQIGLPEFRAGAMENFGLVIYKYQYIAFNPNLHTTNVKQAAAKVMCHELAHQWFGDLVTAEWWSDLFLNEGFAAFFEIESLKFALPEQKTFLEGKFLVETKQKGFIADASLSTSHPIYYNAPIFDDITYKKGPSVLRMAQFVLGKQVFQDALRDYLKSYQYQNTVHEMLFEKFTVAARKYKLKDWCDRELNVSSFLRPWILQQSFPLITVTRDPSTDSIISLQQPYNNVSTLPASSFGYTWPVPLFTRSYKEADSTLRWLNPSYDNCSSSLRIESRITHWEIANSESSSFVRVYYDEVEYSRIRTQLSEFSLSDQVALLSDEIAFLNDKKNSGQPFSYRRLLEMISIILRYSTLHFAPLQLAIPVIDFLENFLIDGPDYPLLQNFMRRIFSSHYDRLLWNVTGDWDNDMTRSYTLPYIVRYNISDSVEQSLQFFETFANACSASTNGVEQCATSLHPDLRRAVYCAAIKYGSKENFKNLLRLYRQQIVYGLYFYQEYYAMLEGLACTQREEDMNVAITELINAFTLSDFKPTFSYISTNPLGSDMMLRFLISNTKTVLDSGLLSNYLSAMTATWYSQSRLDEYAALNSSIFSQLSSQQIDVLNEFWETTRSQVAFAQTHSADIVRQIYDISVDVGHSPWETKLPTNLYPTSYDLRVQPFFPGSAKYPWHKNLTFEASVNISFTVRTATDKIILNAHRLIIDPANVVLRHQNESEEIRFSSLEKDIENGLIILTLQSSLLLFGNSYTLSISYAGFIFSEPIGGVYMNSNFFEFNGKQTWIFTTDFEWGPGVRSLVPCFDEPNYKASWQITLYHPADMTALSNMPDRGTIILEDGWASTTFEKTPQMSSYLVTLAVGHFASLETLSASGVLARVWASTGMERYAESALQVAAGTIDYVSNYLDYAYPLSKLDIVALPQYNGKTNAMGNWGIVCGNYLTILDDPLYIASFDKYLITEITAHETVHQWFGDLVTAKWWTYLFLSEGFAQFLSIDAINKSIAGQEKYTEYRKYITSKTAAVADCSAQSLPVIPDTKIPTSAQHLKGAAVIDMLRNVINSSVLQEGLKLYIRNNHYGTADDTSLWQALTEVTARNNIIGWDGNPLNVQQLMDPWMKQRSIPVLRVISNGSTVKYSQEPFINKTLLPPSDYGYIWTLPVFSQTSSGIQFHYFVDTNGTDPFWIRPLGNSWQVENVANRAYFYVWYDSDTWFPIYNQLTVDFTVFDAVTRAKFISDTEALRRRGSVPWSRLLDLALYLKNDDEYAPFAAFNDTFNDLVKLFRGTNTYDKIRHFVQSTIETAYNKYGWSQNGDWSHDAFSAMVTEYACQMAHSDCLAKASAFFKQFVTRCQYSLSGTGACNPVAPGLRSIQYCYGLSQNASSFETVNSLYRWSVQNSVYFDRDTTNLLSALACVKDEQRITRLIDGVIRGEYPPSTLDFIAKNDESRLVIWNYLTSEPLEVSYGAFGFPPFAFAATSYWNSEEDAAKITAFLESPQGSSLPSGDQNALQTAREYVRERASWLAANQNEVADWLNSHSAFLYSNTFSHS